MSAINGHLLQFYFYIMLTLRVDSVFGSALSPLGIQYIKGYYIKSTAPLCFGINLIRP